MTPKKRKQLAADRRSAETIFKRSWKLAAAARLVPKSKDPRSQIDLPETLDPLFTIQERRAMHKAMQLFEAAHQFGFDVYHLTWCPPEYRIAPGELTPDVIKCIRTIASRRARNIPTSAGRRLIGSVDVAFNPDDTILAGGMWCVHVHALVLVSRLEGRKAQRCIKKAFRAGKDQEQLDVRPTRVERIKSLAHLLRTTSYISGVLGLVDHNQGQNRHRRFREPRQATPFSSYQMLPDALQQELTRLYADLGPKRFWVLSGFRRRGERVEPEPSFTANEAEALKNLRKQRKTDANQRGSFRGAVDALRLF